MSTGGKRENQSSTKSAEGGGNITQLKAPTLFQPAKFMDKSGTPDNQSTSRPKGST